MPKDCSCQSGNRRLALYFPTRRSDDLEYAIQSFGWETDPDSGAYVAGIGPAHRFSTLAQLANFFRALEPEAWHEIRAAWLENGCVTDGASPEPRPLPEMAPTADTPLLEILENGGIETHYQPIFRIDDLSVWGYECLMRARTDDDAMLSPADLLAWAKQENLTFMLDRACRETHVCNAAGADVPENVHFLINFLPTAIYEPAVCLRSTFNAVRRCGIEPQRVTFEVVETEEVRDSAKLREILDAYRDAGFGVALDDLGSGHSGLLLLADLSPDLLKIDRELVSRVHESSIHRAICQAMVSVGEAEGKTVLAEGIETKEQFTVLREMGVELAQGFLLGKPAPEPVSQPLVTP